MQEKKTFEATEANTLTVGKLMYSELCTKVSIKLKEKRDKTGARAREYPLMPTQRLENRVISDGASER